jgi:hypothetical protein
LHAISQQGPVNRKIIASAHQDASPTSRLPADCTNISEPKAIACIAMLQPMPWRVTVEHAVNGQSCFCIDTLVASH